MSETHHIRPFGLQDVPALHQMMQALAIFEGYIDDFRVTPEDLVTLGLGPKPLFHALVAERRGTLSGYAVFYFVPFTYTLKPTAVLKELYVTPAGRSLRVGTALFHSFRSAAAEAGAGKAEWLVLPDNSSAKRFYTRHGGNKDDSWERWHTAL